MARDRRSFFFAVGLCALTLATHADEPTLQIPQVLKAPMLEDFLHMQPNEEWKGKLAHIERFVQRRPKFGQPASQRTEAYFGYDSSNLYIVLVAFDSEPDKIRARLDRRENTSDDEDLMGIYIDTFDDQRRAYQFYCNALGVQTDSIYSEDTGVIDDSFDTVWDSRGQLTPEGFVVWMRVPFKSLRFPNTPSQRWRVLVWRWFPRNSEGSWWPRATPQKRGQLGQSAMITGLEGISPGRSYQFISYGTWRAFRAPGESTLAPPIYVTTPAELNAGLDSKTILRDSMVLDLTVNPDFSQVESDEPQSVVNQRFEVFFPEKRPFFTENANYFELPLANSGTLLFTRRIADPQFGVRLTGKLGPYSIGALLADDQSPGQLAQPVDSLEDERAYFGAFRFSRDFSRQSNAGIMYTERRLKDSYNRIFGLDTTLRFNESWSASFVGTNSWTRNLAGPTTSGVGIEARLRREARSFNYDLQFADYSPDYRTEVGYIKRTDVRYISQNASYTFWPESRLLSDFKVELQAEKGWEHQGAGLYSVLSPWVTVELRRQTAIETYYWKGNDVLRPKDFPVLTKNESFDQEAFGFILTDRSLPFINFRAAFEAGSRLNYVPPEGEQPEVAGYTYGEVTASLRPIGGLTIDNTYILDRNESRKNGRSIFNSHILRSKWNWQLSRELSIRFIGQYNALLSNPELTSAKTSRKFNADFLITYLLHPGTAIYVGYNSNFSRPAPIGSIASDQFVNDARQFFFKVSYLFRI